MWPPIRLTRFSSFLLLAVPAWTTAARGVRFVANVRRSQTKPSVVYAATAALLLVGDLNAAVVVTDNGARMERLADGVYAIIHDNATPSWPHGNTGVIVTAEGVLVVDSAYLPSRALADVALIRSVTDKPVRYLLNTHWHMDHNNGAIAYKKAFPGVTVVSGRKARAFIDLNSTWYAKSSAAPTSSKRAALAALEAELASGRDRTGQPLTAEAKRQLRERADSQRNELAELAALQVIEPDLVFDRELTLVVGGRRVELRNWGPANSPEDVTVFLPEDGVLFTGDIVVQAPLPFFGSSWPVPWIEALQQLEQVPIRALVPGHGPVMRDHTYTRQVREFLEAVKTRVTAMARAGKTLEEIQKDIDVEDKRIPAWSDANLEGDWRVVIKADWKQVVNTLVERVWRGVRGQG